MHLFSSLGNKFVSVLQGKEETFQFLEAVLGEVIELFPSDYIHIGGDEVRSSKYKHLVALVQCVPMNRLSGVYLYTPATRETC